MTEPAAQTGSRLNPPVIPIPALWGHLDRVVDSWFEDHLRGRPAVDSLMYTITALGDHGVLWMLFGAAQVARMPHMRRRRFARVVTGLAVESALVNGPVKWVFRRSRPLRDPLPSRWVRVPRTSSFPSGHSSAAFFGAALLRDHDPLWPLYYGVAVVVAASRIHVRMHHASDVVGGALIGVALGELARRLSPAPAPSIPHVAEPEAVRFDTPKRRVTSIAQ